MTTQKVRGVCRARSAFTLVELLVVIAIIALLVAILLPALSSARCTARQAQNVANLKSLVTAVYNYGGDFKDKIASFTWRGGQAYTFTAPGGGLVQEIATTDLRAVCNQAIDIIRRRAAPDNTGITTTMDNWIPHPTYSHLVLMDFLSARLPEPMLLNPNDRFRQNMAETLRTSPNPTAYCDSLPGTNAGIRSTWPYSSSYQMVPASYCPDRQTGDGGFLQQFEDQIFYQYNPGSGGRYRLGLRKMNEVIFPAQKVLFMEDVGRTSIDCKNEYPFMHPNATITIAAFDGQVRTIKSIEMSDGAYTNTLGGRLTMTMTYNPLTAWGYPPWPGGGTPGDYPGRCRWTYKGLQGIDFGGDER